MKQSVIRQKTDTLQCNTSQSTVRTLTKAQSSTCTSSQVGKCCYLYSTQKKHTSTTQACPHELHDAQMTCVVPAEVFCINAPSCCRHALDCRQMTYLSTKRSQHGKRGNNCPNVHQQGCWSTATHPRRGAGHHLHHFQTAAIHGRALTTFQNVCYICCRCNTLTLSTRTWQVSHTLCPLCKSCFIRYNKQMQTAHWSTALIFLRP